jgi:chemotaxis protein methyltransferase CheR
VTDAECVEFLRWALPRLRLRWEGFRKVRRQVCRRVARRLRELHLPNADAYRAFLESTPEEWRRLDALCRVTISRFNRDRGVFGFLEREVLPDLAERAVARGTAVEAWSVGCASGEEPYSLALAWEYGVRPSIPEAALHVRATDADETMVRRAQAAAYAWGSLRDLPEPRRRGAFVHRGGRYHLRPRFRRLVTIERHDVRGSMPEGAYDLLLCRNLAFTYFDLELQREVADRLALALRPGGALVIGSHETLPEGVPRLVPCCERLRVFRAA